MGMGFVGVRGGVRNLERRCVLPSRIYAGPDMTLICYTGSQDQGQHRQAQDEQGTRAARYFNDSLRGGVLHLYGHLQLRDDLASGFLLLLCLFI